MKIKRKKKKKKEEKKRSEEKNRTQDLRCNRAKAIPLGHVEHTGRFVVISLLKPSSLIKREFKDIFQKNDCSFDSETPT